MLVQIIQDLCHGAAGGIPCEDGFDIFFMIAKKLSPEQNQQRIQKSVSIFLMSQVFNKKIFQGFYRPYYHFQCERSENSPLFYDIIHEQKIEPVRCLQSGSGKRWSGK